MTHRTRGSVAIFALVMVACTATILIAGITLTGSFRTKESRLEQKRIVQNAFDGGVDYCVDRAQNGLIRMPQTLSLTTGNVTQSLLVTDYSATISGTALVTGSLTSSGQVYTLSKVIGSSYKTYDFTYTSAQVTGTAGSGTIVCQSNGGGAYTAISGTLTVSRSSNKAVVGSGYTLNLNPNGTGVASSPSGQFTYDNQFYPALVPMMNSNGLLFVKPGIEIQISGKAGLSNYSLNAYIPASNSINGDKNGTFTASVR